MLPEETFHVQAFVANQSWVDDHSDSAPDQERPSVAKNKNTKSQDKKEEAIIIIIVKCGYFHLIILDIEKILNLADLIKNAKYFK